MQLKGVQYLDPSCRSSCEFNVNLARGEEELCLFPLREPGDILKAFSNQGD